MSGYGDLTHALTIWEPWASAVIHGPKAIENRTWGPPRALVGHRIWIHAGKVFDKDAAEDVWELWPEGEARAYPGGLIIGSARVAGAVSDGNDADFALVDEGARDWYGCSVGWVLTDRVAVKAPIAARGAQGLWVPPTDVLAGLRLVQP